MNTTTRQAAIARARIAGALMTLTMSFATLAQAAEPVQGAMVGGVAAAERHRAAQPVAQVQGSVGASGTVADSQARAADLAAQATSADRFAYQSNAADRFAYQLNAADRFAYQIKVGDRVASEVKAGDFARFD